MENDIEMELKAKFNVLEMAALIVTKEHEKTAHKIKDLTKRHCQKSFFFADGCDLNCFRLKSRLMSIFSADFSLPWS